MRTVLTGLLTAIFMFIVDMGWLTARATFHNNLITSIQGTPPIIRPAPAVLIYILVPLAVMVFAVLPSLELQTAALRGAFLGFCLYGVYDLTNYASFTHYSLEMTLTDMAWGTFLCAAGASVGYTLYRNSYIRKFLRQ